METAPQRDEDDVEFLAHLGQLVVPALGAGLHRHALQHAALHQLVEPRGQRVLRDAEILLEVVEARRAAEAFAKDQERPPLADDVHRAGDGARHAVQADALHMPSRNTVALLNQTK